MGHLAHSFFLIRKIVIKNFAIFSCFSMAPQFSTEQRICIILKYTKNKGTRRFKELLLKKLKIANFFITSLQIFCDYIIQSL